MATVKLIDKDENEPFLTLTLSRREAQAFRDFLGGSCISGQMKISTIRKDQADALFETFKIIDDVL